MKTGGQVAFNFEVSVSQASFNSLSADGLPQKLWRERHGEARMRRGPRVHRHVRDQRRVVQVLGRKSAGCLARKLRHRARLCRVQPRQRVPVRRHPLVRFGRLVSNEKIVS